MKKGDFMWGAALAIVVAILAIPTSHDIFMKFTSLHPFVAGFIKFGILATLGELLAVRISNGNWDSIPKGMVFRAAVWGTLGMLVVLIFEIYGSGIKAAQAKGLLPAGMGIVYAFMVSLINNLTFAPMLMGLHKITDTFIDLRYEDPNEPVTLGRIAGAIDWESFLSFVIFKTIPFFWIPAHTITFMLPPEYKVLFAASLSMALGLLLAMGKKKSVSAPKIEQIV